jgi:cyclase
MLAKRIIPCLDIKDGQTVKGINFLDIKSVGDPVALGSLYAQQGADELVFLDITASHEKRKTLVELVKRIAAHLNIPFTVGGGVSELSDADALLAAGCDKLSINSAAVRNPQLIDQMANAFGSQFVVVAIDAKLENGK